ncbi:helix-turn-helix domain-containing protein [Cloacibacillus porcorum]|uniref:helix-turn-helix domain-containing protein n=1 Tax=Cloacibacillus porcorum TaxID=1197717 RepID=UPI00248E7DD3|nr:helix-turn-helix transcriptional regulator [Cloacibacillus porcorum]
MWNGLNLKKARLNANLDQQDLAEKVHVHPMTISRYETGEREPKASDIDKLAEALGISVGYLFGESFDETGCLSPITTLTMSTPELEQQPSKELSEPLPQPTKLKAPADIINEIAGINAEIGKSASLFTSSEVQAAETLLHCCLENFTADEGASPKQEAAS